MPRRVRRYQAAFVAGALSDQLRGRRDTNAYHLGCHELRNVLATPQGPCRLRPGTRHIAPLPGRARLAPFGDEFVVVFLPEQIQVYSVPGHELEADIEAPFTADELAQLTWAHVGDVMLIAHENHPLQELVRDDPWTIGEYEFERPPQQRYARRSITLDPSGTSGSITITASDPLFVEGMVGEQWEIENKAVTITGYTSETQVTATVDQNLANGNATAEWTQQAASPGAGYFRSVAYHEGRLCLGGTPSAPGRLWLSRTGQPYNFQIQTGTEVVDDDGIALDATSGGRIDAIRHLVSGSGGLEVFTSGHEGVVPSGPDDPIVPSRVKYQPQTAYGTRRYVRPVRLDSQTIFVQQAGGAAREFVYSDIERAYQSVPLTVRATNLVDDPVGMATVAGGFGLQVDFLLIVNADGTGAVMTSQRSEQVAAWADWTSGRLLRDVQTVGARVYFATENAGGDWFLEYVDETARFDALATEDFAHLAGETVALWGDGYDREPVTVGGAGEIETDLAEIEAGFPIEPVVTPMPPDLEDMSLSGRPIRPVRIELRHVRSTGLRVNGRVVTDRPFDDAIETPPTPSPTPRTQRVYLRGWRKDDEPAISITRDGSGGFELISLAVDYAVSP